MSYSANTINKYIELSFLGQAWISAFACLVRTDYNFAFALFSYYYWTNKASEQDRLKIILLLNGVLIGFDILWLLTTASFWGETYPNASVWNSTTGIRKFSIYCSGFNAFFKLVTCLLIYLFQKKGGKVDPETVGLSGADYIGNDVPYDLRPVNQGPVQSQFPGVGMATSQGFNPNQQPSQSYNPAQSYNPSQSYNPGQSYNPAQSYGPGQSYNPAQSYGGQGGLVQSGFIQPGYSQGNPRGF